jgi:hypothetical protein
MGLQLHFGGLMVLQSVLSAKSMQRFSRLLETAFFGYNSIKPDRLSWHSIEILELLTDKTS